MRFRAVLLLLSFASSALAAEPRARRGVTLEELTWLEAEQRLQPGTVVVIPLGAAAKEHGPHLRLDNDRLIADYLRSRVLRAADVVIAPTVTYSFYPAFVEYPGSTSLRFETARDVVVDICRSLSRFGPRRFYVLNTGISTKGPLSAAAEVLRSEGILMTFTDLAMLSDVEKKIRQQEGGTHADEIETSMMLYIAPQTVDMKKAVRDYHPDGGPLTRHPAGKGTYSASGVWGDATLATKAKGRIVVEELVRIVLADIETLRARQLDR